MKNLFLTLLSASLLYNTISGQTVTFVNFTTADGLADNFISGGVAVDQNNNKWFGTGNGVSMYNNSSWITYTVSDGLPDNYINCLTVDIDNNVWVGTDGYGAAMFNGSTWTTFTTTDGLVDNAVYSIGTGSDGSVWFGTYAGLSRLKNSVWATYTTADGLASDITSCITEDLSGNIWIGTWGSGVSKFDGSDFTNYSTAGNLIDNNISCISVQENGNIWFGTINMGISVFSSSGSWLYNITQTDGLFENYIRDIKFDSQGNVWLGIFVDYLFDGVISLNTGTGNWTNYGLAEGLIDPQIKRLALDQNEDLWITTGGGVSKVEYITGLYSRELESGLFIYPNPASEKVRIFYNGSSVSPVKAEVYNSEGCLQTVLTINSDSGGTVFSTANLSNGIYCIRYGEKAMKLIINK